MIMWFCCARRRDLWCPTLPLFKNWASEQGYALCSLRQRISVETAQIYLETTLAMKEQALAKTSPPHATPGRYRRGDQLLNFLDNL
jgi:hypothetical protein